MRFQLPFTTRGQTIGLLGGSFDPPHAGHVHITRQAMRRFGLDRVWWIVSPGNPLKKNGPAEFERRFSACQQVTQHPRVLVSDLEQQFGTTFTADTLQQLLPLFPSVRFVWLMGADNLAQFHHWDNWRKIIATVPIGVLARPGQVVQAGLSPVARTYSRYRIPARQSGALAHHTAPCWSLVTGPTVDISSTEIRDRGDWVR
jgi:nicotinate-nucleotide adenylyltransferase